MVSQELAKQLARLRADIIAILKRHDVEASLAGREETVADEILHSLVARIDLATEKLRGQGRDKKPD